MSASMQPWRCPWLGAGLSQEHASCWRETNSAEGVSQSWSVGRSLLKTPEKGVSRLEFIYKKCPQMLVQILICQRWSAVSCFWGRTWLESEYLWGLLKTAVTVTWEGEAARLELGMEAPFCSDPLVPSIEKPDTVSAWQRKMLIWPICSVTKHGKKGGFEAIK